METEDEVKEKIPVLRVSQSPAVGGSIGEVKRNQSFRAMRRVRGGLTPRLRETKGVRKAEKVGSWLLYCDGCTGQEKFKGKEQGVGKRMEVE